MDLNLEQKSQINKQIEAYENGQGKGSIIMPVGETNFVLEVDDYVASPLIMNSGIELVHYMVTRKDLFQDKVVVDMGCGSGIIGITASLFGARHVYMIDLEERAVSNTQKNIEHLNLSQKCTVIKSDLFEKLDKHIKVDIHIFNHPYFSGNLIPEKPWTRMMLGGVELLRDYLKQAPQYAHKDTVYMFSWLDIAENYNQVDNNPKKCAPEFGYYLTKDSEIAMSDIGIQKGKFSFYEFLYQD